MLAGAPGETATLRGRLVVDDNADDVVVTGLRLDGRNDAELPSPTVNGDRDHGIYVESSRNARIVDNVICLGEIAEQEGFSAGENRIAEPLFVDRERGDFRQRPERPCLPAGPAPGTAALVPSVK